MDLGWPNKTFAGGLGSSETVPVLAAAG